MQQRDARGWRQLAAVGISSGILLTGLTGGWYAYAHTTAPELIRGALAQEAPWPTPESPPATAQTAAAQATSFGSTVSTPSTALAAAQRASFAAKPAASPVPGQQAQPAGKPAAQPAAKPAGNPNSRRPFGEVTAISQNPPSFTIRTPAGQSQTFSVLQTTVFAAGRDRPYRFDLLKVGDSVTVATGGGGAGAGQGNRKQAPGAGQPPGQSATPSTGQPPAQNAAAGPKPRPAQRQGQGPAANPRAAIRAALANGETVARAVLVHPAGEAARPGGRRPGGQTGAAQRTRRAPVATPAAVSTPVPTPQTNGQPSTNQQQGGANGTGQ